MHYVYNKYMNNNTKAISRLLKSTPYFYSSWIHLIYLSCSKYISVTSFVHNTCLKTCLILRCQILVSFAFKGALPVQASCRKSYLQHLQTIILESGQRKPQWMFRFLVHNNLLYCSSLLIFFDPND